ncbi:MAG TPA: DUF6789 family protein [Candidatus Limnocylindrales bacterium]|nr:DUF6789 family protein [Candidatus Limnocylindrales bacterium]
MTLARRVASGAGAGVGATLLMTAFMFAAKRAGMLVELAPRTITRRASDQLLDRRPGPEALDAASAVTHLGVGVGWGLLHALLLSRLRLRMPGRLAVGALYGLAIWTLSYWAALPRLGLMPPPSSDERQRPQAMALAHLVYGSALALLDRSSSGHDGSSDRSR